MTSVLTPSQQASERTGELPADPAEVIRLVEPLPGFDGELDFVLSRIDADGVLWAMRSVRDPQLRFVLTPSACFFPDYAPELGAAVASALDVDEDATLDCLLVLTVPSDLRDATANLRAPIVRPIGGGTAMQVVLDDESLSMHEPLLPAA
ncbi:flagellar assembly protein FliW [Jatrophihabitans fulvus]